MNNYISHKNTKPVALITGGAVRIGAAICRTLSQKYSIALHYNSSSTQAESLQAELTDKNAAVVLFQADLTRPKACKKLADAVVNKLGQIDLLVNNAAVFYKDDAELFKLAKMKVLNMDAPEHLINALVPRLKKNGGSIVNIADIAGICEFTNYKAYSRTKKELLTLTRRQTVFLAENNIRINAVCPGTVQFAAHCNDEEKKRIVEAIPMKKIGRPQDIADAVWFLANSTFVTGQIITIDGGRLAAQLNIQNSK